MSLINDALKRADAEKLRACDEDQAIPLPPTERGSGRRITPLAAVLALLAGATFCIVTWRLLDRNLEPPGPRQAAAENATFARTDGEEPSESKGEPRINVSPEAELAFQMTMDSLRYYEPPPASEKASSEAPEADAAPEPAARASGTPGESQRKPLFEDPGNPAQPPSAPVEPAPQPEAGPESFRLTGIMRGPDGAVAIINGNFVRLGDTIAGARIVRIAKYEVELQTGQGRFKIGM